jgi:predicted dithiol-disulfide oxidoreductase (DUF899 family)
MLGPDDEAGCTGCSFLADNLPSHLEHLNSKDTALVLVSRAPYEKIVSFKERMGWNLPWFSSYKTDFNFDFHVTNDEEVAPVMYNVSIVLERSSLLVQILTCGQYKTKEEMANDKHNMGKGEQPGLSVFFKEGDEIFHTYSSKHYL